MLSQNVSADGRACTPSVRCVVLRCVVLRCAVWRSGTDLHIIDARSSMAALGNRVLGGNMNGCHIASMRLAGLLSFSIDCVYMEGSQGKADILVAQTASNGLSVGTGNGGTISNCRMASGTANCIHFDNWSIQTSGYLIHGNLFG
eukprot:SAG11_NODE_4739_length_1784_cov_3.214243_1_plen_144_part_10